MFLHEPKVGQAHYDLRRGHGDEAPFAVGQADRHPRRGVRFNAAYELYAHVATAAAEGMDPAKIATLAAGGRPLDLTPEEACAFDVATTLTKAELELAVRA